VSGKRVYLESQNLLTLSGNPQTTVYWTELDALPESISKQLKKGESPWTTIEEKRAIYDKAHKSGDGVNLFLNNP
jgi:hypothetical protein